MLDQLDIFWKIYFPKTKFGPFAPVYLGASGAKVGSNTVAEG